MGKKVAVIQSNYIPWKGYFDILNMADEFILFDDMQYTRRDWRNRNKIKTPSGLQWLTIPVISKGLYTQKIRETVVDGTEWRKDHWKTLCHNYKHTKHFANYKALFEQLYLGSTETQLSLINYSFLTAICEIFGIKTRISWSMDYQIVDGKMERLISLCEQVNGDEYISGPTAKGYIDEQVFENAGIKLTYMDYTDYPEYEQLYPPFEHYVSILDLIFHEGPNATCYMKSFR